MRLVERSLVHPIWYGQHLFPMFLATMVALAQNVMRNAVDSVSAAI